MEIKKNHTHKNFIRVKPQCSHETINSDSGSIFELFINERV